MFLITKQFKFDSAHNLINYKGKCENIHGHTYFLDVTLKGEKQSDGMVLDFTLIKKAVYEKILNLIDHSYINDIIDISTAENIIEWIWAKLKTVDFPNNINLYELKLWEGPHSYVTYRGGEDFEC